MEIATEGGEIEIVDFNVFEAGVYIYNSSPSEKMYIGCYNYFEMKAMVENTIINNFNQLKMYATTTDNKVKDCCVVGMNSKVPAGLLMDHQLYSSVLGLAPNHLSIHTLTGYQNTRSSAYKKIYETKMKNRIKLREAELKKQASKAVQPKAA